MKKTVKVIRELDVVKFETSIQNLLNEGYELQFSTSYPLDKYPTYVAAMIKTEVQD